MEIKRNATARWEGSGKDGKGSLSTASTTLKDTQYSFNTRFENGVGTNPEELVAAAHAGCFAMQLAFNIQGAGFTATFIDAKAVITLDTNSSSISSSKPTVTASVPDLTKEKFDELVAHAEKNCPISKLFNTAISVDATLE